MATIDTLGSGNSNEFESPTFIRNSLQYGTGFAYVPHTSGNAIDSFVVQLTNHGITLFENSWDFPNFTQAIFTPEYDYIPSKDQEVLKGLAIHRVDLSPPIIDSGNYLKLEIILPTELILTFGEIGIFDDQNKLVAVAVSQNEVVKNDDRVKVINIFLPLVGSNYPAWFNLTGRNEQQISIISNVDFLPSAKNAIPNLYVVASSTEEQTPFLAFTDRSGVWSFEHYDRVANLTIVGSTNNTVVVEVDEWLKAYDPLFVGYTIIQFLNTPLLGICRVVQSTHYTLDEKNIVITFNSLTSTPPVGSKIQIWLRVGIKGTAIVDSSGKTIAYLKLGRGLKVTSGAQLELDPLSTVTSVNNFVGDVVLEASDIVNLAPVAISNQFDDLTNIPTSSTTNKGLVQIGTSGNLSITNEGLLDFFGTPVRKLNNVAPDSAGNLNIDFEAISRSIVSLDPLTNLNAIISSGSYSGINLFNAPNSNAGLLQVSNTNDILIQTWYDGRVVYNRTRDINTETWSGWIAGAILEPATTSSLGMVQIGSGLAVSINGVLSIPMNVAGQPPALGSDGKLPQSVLPEISGVFQGSWDAENNIPDLFDWQLNNPRSNGFWIVTNGLYNKDLEGNIFNIVWDVGDIVHIQYDESTEIQTRIRIQNHKVDSVNSLTGNVELYYDNLDSSPQSIEPEEDEDTGEISLNIGSYRSKTIIVENCLNKEIVSFNSGINGAIRNLFFTESCILIYTPDLLELPNNQNLEVNAGDVLQFICEERFDEIEDTYINIWRLQFLNLVSGKALNESVTSVNGQSGNVVLDLTTAADTVQTNLTTHINDKSNPHAVTTSQIGISWGTTDLIAGVSPLITGGLHFVYD